MASTATIGILGGGQLGRMLSIAASRLGLHAHILSPEDDPVAAHVAHRATRADFDDVESLVRFARSVDVVTYEFENIPVAAVDTIAAIRPVRPGRRALLTSQDRLLEKDFFNGLGLRTAPYRNIESPADIDVAAGLGRPAILKTRRFGYDGKGQRVVETTDSLGQAWEDLGRVPCIVEGLVEFDCEISVIAARSSDGLVAAYDPGRNFHRDGILRTTTVPAALDAGLTAAAVSAAEQVLGALDYVGVIGIEFFVAGDELVVNEMAPRVHNSGHWTQNGCVVDQFEQHIRAVAGWPLGDGSRHSDVVMTNLIGDDVAAIPDLAADPAVALHVYGKRDIRDGRKMGHFNRVTGPAT